MAGAPGGRWPQCRGTPAVGCVLNCDGGRNRAIWMNVVFFSSAVLDFYYFCVCVCDCQLTLQLLVLEAEINKSERFLMEASQGLWRSWNRPIWFIPFIWQRRKQACEVKVLSHWQAKAWKCTGIFWSNGTVNSLRISVGEVGSPSLLLLVLEQKDSQSSGQILWALMVAEEKIIIHFGFITHIVDLLLIRQCYKPTLLKGKDRIFRHQRGLRESSSLFIHPNTAFPIFNISYFLGTQAPTLRCMGLLIALSHWQESSILEYCRQTEQIRGESNDVTIVRGTTGWSLAAVGECCYWRPEEDSWYTVETTVRYTLHANQKV